MEEGKNLQQFYAVLRIAIYVSIFLEIFLYAVPGEAIQSFSEVVFLLHERMAQFPMYQHQNLHLSKIATVVLVCVTCIGTRNRKMVEFDARKMILYPLLIGFALLLGSWWFFYTDNMITKIGWFPFHIWLYIFASLIGTMGVHLALDNASKYLAEGLMKDRFNFENESFQQNEKFKETKYSVNIPMRYYYKGKFRHGWININNPFRGTFVVGTPGSGKTFSVIEPFIRQHSKKGFSMVVYDYKFPTLAQKLYYHYRINKKAGKTPKGCQFNIINFVNVEYSKRVNPIQHKYIDSLAAAQETAETLVESLQKGKKDGGGGSDQFFQTSAVNFLAACIFFFVNHKRMPYNADGKQLFPEYIKDPQTGHEKLSGRVFRTRAGRDTGNVLDLVEPAYWLGEYSDMPHVLSFLNHDYKEIFEILATDPEVYPLLGPFMTAYQNKAMEQLEGMIGTLRVQISRLATKEAYWIFAKDGDDFDLKVSDPKHPSYLLIANDPEKESIIGALNAMILNRLVTRVNSGQGKNVPVDICVDEVPTLYFHKIDRLIGTARSNKVAVILGFQELPQLEADYGKTGMQKIVTTIGNVISGSARSKETLEWLSNDIFGKTVQMKKGVTVSRESTSVNFNENMDAMVPASKISDMPSGWICGQVARDFTPTKTGIGGSINIQTSEEFATSKFYCKTNFNMDEIKAEEDDYKNYPLPVFYKFGSKHERERVLYNNYTKIDNEVKKMINDIQTEIAKHSNK